MTSLHRYKYVKNTPDHSSLVMVGNMVFGGKFAPVIAGPCAVESYDSMLTIARRVAKSGASMLRGGAFKPRTSPYDFQGLGEEGLEILQEVGRQVGLPVVTEVLDIAHIGLVSKYTDMLQVGARNMQNFALLRALGKISKPILLKRGLNASVLEWLKAAEDILQGGNDEIVLCERGIKSFHHDTRNTFDLAGMVLAKSLTHLPIIADPSHATGLRNLIVPMSYAAIAAGSDGLMVEVHITPEKSVSDADQAISCKQFAGLMHNLRKGMFGKRVSKTFTEAQQK
jgi:3-deoxy-7-phosphoheptulonate synthase